MAKGLNGYAFEAFPRGDLSIKFSRRQLLSTFSTELRVQREQSRGGPGYRLSELGSWPDELLALLVPVAVSGCVISEKEGFVWGYPSETGRPRKLFPVDSPASAAFSRFDGQTPLGALGRHLAVEMGWEAARGVAYVRGLFLHLVTLGVCLPK